MSFLDELRAAPNSPTASWNTFIMEYLPGGQALFVVHEGRDDPSFYRSHVASRMPAGWRLRFVCCGTKKGVLDRAGEFARRHPPDPRVLFFVDKDHDDLIDKNAERPYRWTYTTTCYAIENYVCTAQVVRAFLTDIVGLPDTDESCDVVVQRYEASKSELHHVGLPIMAWIVAARRQGLTLNLNNIDNEKLFNVADDLTPTLADSIPAVYSYLAAVTGGREPNLSPPDEDIQSELAQLEGVTSQTWFRGKQDLWFLVKFLNRSVELLRACEKTGRVSVQISRVNALQILGPRAPLPGCLAEFLDAVFAEILNLQSPVTPAD